MIRSIQYYFPLSQSADYESSQNSVLSEGYCIKALVYLKTVSYFHLCLQVRAVSVCELVDEAMIQKLKSCLDMADTNTVQTRALFLRMIF
jgi:hypothetical protein